LRVVGDPPRRRRNIDRRPREYLTPAEVETLMVTARKRGRYGHRDATMILIAYRHGLRVSELCRLEWSQVDFESGLLHVARLKGSISTTHPLRGIELRALRRLKREQEPSRHVWISERGAPMSAGGFRQMLRRTGEESSLGLSVHPHMLRHACGYKIANESHDTRALQLYLGHKDIRHTGRYSELSSTAHTRTSRRIAAHRHHLHLRSLCCLRSSPTDRPPGGDADCAARGARPA
jgi:type 1 fimbriae regulatory protein FimB/type 1 fimbriae regulatory protein FimE